MTEMIFSAFCKVCDQEALATKLASEITQGPFKGWEGAIGAMCLDSSILTGPIPELFCDYDTRNVLDKTSIIHKASVVVQYHPVTKAWVVTKNHFGPVDFPITTDLELLGMTMNESIRFKFLYLNVGPTPWPVQTFGYLTIALSLRKPWSKP